MKSAAAILAAMLALAPAVAFAQSESGNGRGNGDKAVGPASENGDASTSNTKQPGGMGRSAYPDNSATSAPETPPAAGSVPPTETTGSGKY
ncbi:conserved hypothetical protein [Methylocella silvestris BL2]|uniref:Lipoprotein n=1 Tax=Methylocella silvestris (strain DSM 15510 / CIP 108128 / LMG 27833 / NCIMB 13906 / BL2) TaxID=395965 RepID=B8EJK1_METSB|nr:hypothetical protein [Methylocella silvestris]ACK49405.1 conserved hypothetical protein [Methylocella silvestris BL2]